MVASDKAELLTMALLKGITGLIGRKRSKHNNCDCQLILQLHTGGSPDHTPLVPLAPQVLLSLPTMLYPVLQV